MRTRMSGGVGGAELLDFRLSRSTDCYRRTTRSATGPGWWPSPHRLAPDDGLSLHHVAPGRGESGEFQVV